MPLHHNHSGSLLPLPVLAISPAATRTANTKIHFPLSERSTHPSFKRVIFETLVVICHIFLLDPLEALVREPLDCAPIARLGDFALGGHC